jgi:hypothetical protein
MVFLSSYTHCEIDLGVVSCAFVNNQRIMKKLLLFASIIALISCEQNSSPSTGGSDHSSTGEYQEAKGSLESQERNNPLSFLSVTGNYRKNLVGKFVINGSIQNKATIATYKDVQLKLNYYSKTGSFLGAENKIIYEFYGPGSSRSFSIKSAGYSGAKSVKIDVTGAKAK